MFILRQVSTDGRQSNTWLGKEYSLIKKEESQTEFERIVSTQFQDTLPDHVYAFVHSFDVGFIPLYAIKGQSIYIVSSNGETYDNITAR